jgi:hypothetical protein
VSRAVVEVWKLIVYEDLPLSIRETFTHPVFRDARAPAASPLRAEVPLVPAVAARKGGAGERRQT